MYLQGLAGSVCEEPGGERTFPASGSSPMTRGLPISTGFDAKEAAELFDRLMEELLFKEDDRPILFQENDFFRDLSLSPLLLSWGLRLPLNFIRDTFVPIRVPRVRFLRSRLIEVFDRSVASSLTCFPPLRISETTSTCCRPCTSWKHKNQHLNPEYRETGKTPETFFLRLILIHYWWPRSSCGREKLAILLFTQSRNYYYYYFYSYKIYN